MAGMDNVYVTTMDFPWFAVDEVGQLASLRTDGFETVPASVWVSIETNTMLGDFFDALPSRGTFILDDTFWKRIPGQQWQPLDVDLHLSVQGLYVYEATTNYAISRNLYHRICWPSRPLTLAELPQAIQAIIGRTRLNGQTFAGLPVMDVSAIL